MIDKVPSEQQSLNGDGVEDLLSKALPELKQEPTLRRWGAPAAREAVRQLAVTNPILARAKLRIELERTLHRLHGRTGQSASSP